MDISAQNDQVVPSLLQDICGTAYNFSKTLKINRIKNGQWIQTINQKVPLFCIYIWRLCNALIIKKKSHMGNLRRVWISFNYPIPLCNSKVRNGQANTGLKVTRTPDSHPHSEVWESRPTPHLSRLWNNRQTIRKPIGQKKDLSILAFYCESIFKTTSMMYII